ncbi:MAG: T9SS type A sorting domain-containing protein [Candidatus Aegiribacteria sp.]
MRTLFLIVLTAGIAMAFPGEDTQWENLSMESTVSHCITWDDNGGRILVGTYEGFHYLDLSDDTWTVVEESGMMGREVYSIDAGSTVPEIIITGRANGFDKGYIDVSFDLGQNWDYYYPSNGGAFWAMHEDVSTPGTFYCGAISDVEPGELVVSTDNGQTWTELTKPQSAITDITQTLMGTLYTCGIPYVYRSDDGGATWTEAAGGLSSSTIFYAIAAEGMNPDNLVCSDEDGLYRTTDGGDNWTQVTSDWCMAIEYSPIEPTRLAAVTIDGTVIGSTDGGENWFDITGDLPGYAMDLAFCGEEDHLYVTTMYEGTYRTPAGFTGVAEDQGEAGSFGLTLDVSPNPVTGAAAVSYSLPQGGSARLDVFDLTGRLISTLENGEMASGSHQTLFSASDNGPGVFFVRLTTDSGSLVQKVLVSR